MSDAQACNAPQTQARCPAGSIYYRDDTSTYVQLSNTPVTITYGIDLVALAITSNSTNQYDRYAVLLGPPLPLMAR
jgi:hypothetical protein